VEEKFQDVIPHSSSGSSISPVVFAPAASSRALPSRVLRLLSLAPTSLLGGARDHGDGHGWLWEAARWGARPAAGGRAAAGGPAAAAWEASGRAGCVGGERQGGLCGRPSGRRRKRRSMEPMGEVGRKDEDKEERGWE
jgi:hypothetical protein